MRDILTILAGLLIAVLVAALAVPPLLDWRQHRAWVDAAISRAAGTEAATDGTLEIRLLPSPRLRADRLRLGREGADTAVLDATFLKAEIALTPLLHGEVRFLDTRIGRAEIKLPTGAAGAWRVPPRLLDGASGHSFVFEDVRVAQLLLTSFDAATGRTDQAFAERVRLQAAAAAGPWRIDGLVSGIPIAIATGELGRDLSAQVKATIGGEGAPRLDLDSRLQLRGSGPDALVPTLAGTARLTAAAGQGGIPLALVAAASFEAAGRVATLEGLTVEAGEGAATLRFAGSGRYEPGRLSLALEGRRVDLAGLVADPAALDRLRSVRLPRGGIVETLDATLKLDSVAVADDTVSNVNLAVSLDAERLRLERLVATLPGPTTLEASGEAGLGVVASGTGRIVAESVAGDRLGPFLDRLGLGTGLISLLDGRPLSLSADLGLVGTVTSFRNLRARLGDTTLAGTVRYAAREGGARPRIDAQLSVRGLDLRTIPDALPAVLSVGDTDLGLILDARDVGIGTDRRAGRIAARLASEGDALIIERLEVADLAGASANVSGRILADGSGRIEGRLQAARAASVLDLAGATLPPALAGLLPEPMRAASLDLALTLERDRRDASAGSALRLRLAGSAATGRLTSDLVVASGAVRRLSGQIDTERAGTWLGSTSAALARPGRLTVDGARDASGRMTLTLAGDIAGIALTTASPLVLGPAGPVLGGEASLRADDPAPLFALIGEGGPTPAGPTSVAVLFEDGTAGTTARLSGRLAGIGVDGRLAVVTEGGTAAWRGAIRTDRFSAPWLASVLALRLPSSAAGALGGRFGALPDRAWSGEVSIRTPLLDLGAGLRAEDASFEAAAGPDGLAIRNLVAKLAGGRLAGSLNLSRQGGLAALVADGTLDNADIVLLAGPGGLTGRLSAALRLGGSGESAAGLMANLGGAGTVRLDGLTLPAADPSGIERAVARALRGDDPLAQGRLASLVAEELGRGPLRAERAEGPAAVTGGVVRLTPLKVETAEATWTGSATFDLRSLNIEARGNLAARTLPRGWSGGSPVVGLGWTGPVAKLARVLDVAPLTNGLAAVVLSRELDRIDTFDLDAAERSRIGSRVELDRERRAAAEEAARQARLREEAERARAALEAIRPPPAPDRSGLTPLQPGG